MCVCVGFFDCLHTCRLPPALPRGVCLCGCLSFCVCICTCVCMAVCMSICICVCVCVCASGAGAGGWSGVRFGAFVWGRAGILAGMGEDALCGRGRRARGGRMCFCMGASRADIGFDSLHTCTRTQATLSPSLPPSFSLSLPLSLSLSLHRHKHTLVRFRGRVGGCPLFCVCARVCLTVVYALGCAAVSVCRDSCMTAAERYP